MEVFTLNQDLSSGKISSLYEVEKFLSEWIVLHILIEDKKYMEYLT